MVERLEQILKKKNLSPAQLADEIGIQRSGIYHIMKGRNKPGLDFLTKLLNHFPEINPGWLILGKGSMISNQEISLVEEPIQFGSAKSVRNETTQAGEDKTLKKSKTHKSSKEDTQKGVTKKIEKILVFYEDQTFTEYNPNEKPV